MGRVPGDQGGGRSGATEKKEGAGFAPAPEVTALACERRRALRS